MLASCLDDQEDFWNRFYSNNNFSDIIVFDPFMGSGVTIGEAIKLGCQAVGRDINPIAYFSCRASFSRYDIRNIRRTYRILSETLGPKLLSYFATQTETG